jgi:hypothetical protein
MQQIAPHPPVCLFTEEEKGLLFGIWDLEFGIATGEHGYRNGYDKRQRFFYHGIHGKHGSGRDDGDGPRRLAFPFGGNRVLWYFGGRLYSRREAVGHCVEEAVTPSCIRSEEFGFSDAANCFAVRFRE